MLFSQEPMNDKSGVIAILAASVPPVVSVRTYYAKAADSGSQLWLEKLQLQISGGSACAHPQGTLAWSCSYLQDSLVSAAESHLSPFPVQ